MMYNGKQVTAMGRISTNLGPEAVASVQTKALDCSYRNISELFKAIASDEVALVPFRMLTLFRAPESWPVTWKT